MKKNKARTIRYANSSAGEAGSKKSFCTPQNGRVTSFVVHWSWEETYHICQERPCSGHVSRGRGGGGRGGMDVQEVNKAVGEQGGRGR